jgi:methyl-accepting chemotaxis protein
MKGFRRLFSRLSAKLILAVCLIILIMSSTVGFVNYSFAKKELIASGKLDLEHLVQTSISTLDALNEEVKQGDLTLDEAKEKAREMINGPKKNVDGKQQYDYSQSPFLYKENGYLFVYDSEKRVELHPVLKIGEKVDSPVIESLISAARSGNREDHFYTYDWKNPGETKEREKISYMTYYEPWGWHIGIGAYTEEFYESLETVRTITILLTIALTVISLGGFYLLIRPKIKVLNQLAFVSGKIAEDDLRVARLPESSDELGQLGGSFNRMADSLRQLAASLQHTSGKLVDSASDLSAISEETSASSEETSRAIAEISHGMVSQSSDIDEMSRTIEDFTRSLEKIAGHSRGIQGITAQSEKTALNGKEMVGILKKANRESLEASDQISVSITSLYSKITGISEITEAINSISAQTNLLALNASIEAARAGEHGKGFAVVAEEVRKLAEESNSSTAKIQNMIKAIEKETEMTVGAIANTVTLSQQLTEAVGKTEHDFNEIAIAVAQTAKAVDGLNEEISLVTGQSEGMLGSVQSIAAMAQEASAAAEQISASADEQNQAISNTALLAENLTVLSEELNNHINKYKINEENN